MHVVVVQNKVPNLRVSSLEQVTSLSLEHGVLICHTDKLKIVLTLGERNDREAGVTFLAVLADYKGIVLVVLLQETFGVVVACDIG
jgi:hypothetical protein